DQGRRARIRALGRDPAAEQQAARLHAEALGALGRRAPHRLRQARRPVARRADRGGELSGRRLGFYWLFLAFLGFRRECALAFLGFWRCATLAFLGFSSVAPWLSLAFRFAAAPSRPASAACRRKAPTAAA